MSDFLAESAAPRIGIAVTTVGRWDALGDLLTDLARQSRRPTAVAIAYHDADGIGELETLVNSVAGSLDVRTVHSPRGISNGRNAAAALLGDDVDWLCFPNDTSRLDDDFIDRISAHATPDRTVCAVQLVDREGVRNAMPPTGTPMTRRTVWGAIEPATMVSRQAFERVGGFDPSIGSGAQTPWQSGEGTDLLLRMSELDGFSIDWIHDIAVHAQTEFTHLAPSERSRKIRYYGRGSGYLYRRWDYPAWDKFRHVFGALLAPVRKRGKFRPRDGLALAIGRAEGVCGRTLPGSGDNRAIVR